MRGDDCRSRGGDGGLEEHEGGEGLKGRLEVHFGKGGGGL